MKTNRFEMFNFYSTSFESNHFQIYRRESEDRYRILEIGEIGNVRELTRIEFDSFFKLTIGNSQINANRCEGTEIHERQ